MAGVKSKSLKPNTVPTLKPSNLFDTKHARDRVPNT
jgi:hypothetical protein